MDVIVSNVVVGKISVFNNSVSKEIGKKKCYVCADIDFDLFENIIEQPFVYEDVSKYPQVNLDYTIICNKEMLYQDVDNILERFNDDLIISRNLKDIYASDTAKKITVNFVVGASDHTLNSEELSNFKEKFISYVKAHNLNINE